MSLKQTTLVLLSLFTVLSACTVQKQTTNTGTIQNSDTVNSNEISDSADVSPLSPVFQQPAEVPTEVQEEPLPVKPQRAPAFNEIHYDLSKTSLTRVHSNQDVVQFVFDTAKEDLQLMFKDHDIAFPPKYLKANVYKRSYEFELWAGNTPETAVAIARFPICSMDFVPGPKLQQGDERTPEGRYHLTALGHSKNWWMWIDPFHIEDEGKVGSGHSYYYCTEYPNETDKQRSRSIGIRNPGNAICLHGNCASLGCVSLTNDIFTTVFALLYGHDEKKYGPIELNIFPFRLEDIQSLAEEAEKAASFNEQTQALGAEKIRVFWEQLFTEP